LSIVVSAVNFVRGHTYSLFRVFCNQV